ncbi:helix-turn-helix domain-containing protein [Alkalibacterium iburiense]|uniref:Helix-turn-helix domain-containing protein n=1 Tax=Alkalibacterium iburiense TaxID=290589 RepID=A0ABN0X6T5_9LACT
MKNKGSLFTSLFLLLSLLISSIIILFISWTYISTTSNVEEEYLINRRHNLVQMVNTIESELQNIEYAFNAYSTTDSYQTVIEYPLTESDFSIYREITTQLNYFSTPSFSNTTYTLISLEEDWAVNQNRLLNLDSEESARIREYYIENNPSSLYWDQDDDNGMSVITLLPIHSRAKNGIGIAHVSTGDINQLINSQGIHFPIIILNNEGSILYDSGYENDSLTDIIPNLDIEAILASSNNDISELRIENEEEEPFYLLANESSYNNLVYLTALYDYEIQESLYPTLLGFIILGVLLVLFSVALAWFLSDHLTKPIRQLKIAVGQGNTEPKKLNDFIYLKDSFETMKTQNDALQTILDIEKPALKRQFVLNAFLGKVSLNDLDEKQESYHFPTIDNPVFYALVVQLDSRMSKNDNVRLFKLLHILEELIPEENQYAPVVLSEESVGTIIAFDSTTEKHKKQLITFSEQIVKQSKEDAELLVSIGISPGYHDFKETRDSYKKATISLSYKMLLGNQSIISYEDIKPLASNHYTGAYFTNLEDSIFKAIQLGNTEEAKKHSYPFLASLYKSNPTPSAIEFALLRFFINLSKLDQKLETQIMDRSLMEKYYQTILFHKNLVDIEHTLISDIIVPMSEKMKSRTNEQFKQVSEQIKEMIQNKFQEDISLDTISEELNYNPNYISSIFKKETGITFSDYLIEFRLNKAKEWLVETDLTVKKIAENLQYGNSQNFIRSFKKRESVTPGQYRKQHKLS